MSKGLLNPTNGKTYTFKGFTPLNRVSDECQNSEHIVCSRDPHALITWRDFDYVSKNCCLCQCHFSEGVNL